MEEENNQMEELVSELAYLGEKMTEISKYLRKMSNWQDSDEAKWGDKEEEEEL